MSVSLLLGRRLVVYRGCLQHRGSKVGMGVGVGACRRYLSPVTWYNHHLETRPVLTKCITAGVLFALGDVIAQHVSNFLKGEGERFNWPRMGRAWLYGTFIFGPLAHIHFNVLEWLVVRKLGLKGGRMAFSKMFIDQFTYFTPGINCIYLFTLPILEGRSRHEATDNVRSRLWPTLKANWTLWPPAQIVNFMFVPVAHQLNFVLMVSLVWAFYLSWATGEANKRREKVAMETRP